MFNLSGMYKQTLKFPLLIFKPLFWTPKIFKPQFLTPKIFWPEFSSFEISKPLNFQTLNLTLNLNLTLKLTLNLTFNLKNLKVRGSTGGELFASRNNNF